MVVGNRNMFFARSRISPLGCASVEMTKRFRSILQSADASDRSGGGFVIRSHCGSIELARTSAKPFLTTRGRDARDTQGRDALATNG